MIKKIKKIIIHNWLSMREDWASYTHLGLGLGPLDLGMAHMELGLDMAYSITLLGNIILL